MKVWITKGALTHGVRATQAEVIERTCGSMIRSDIGYFSKPDWHETEAEATQRAEDMRLRGILSLTRQISKLKKLRFKGEQ